MAERSRRQVKKNQDLQRMEFIEKERERLRIIRRILKKPASNRTEDDTAALLKAPELVLQIETSIKRFTSLKERAKEIIDEPENLSFKCSQLAAALKESKFTVLYTGAGISTSAQIPDYRGPDGVWTQLQQGKDVVMKDLSLAEPTFTHMAIKQLHKQGLISHVVSQNCDGLHIRSGLPKSALSELHGNMFVEVCPKCKPLKQYFRLFDVTEQTGLHRHKTGRFCKKCETELHDTIVHFGEKGSLPWPMNWKGAVKAVEKADLILCLGSSLKVLRRYPNLWRSDQPQCKRPKLYIVNLQWTPKDTQATLKIHGKCDDVMKGITSCLGITVPEYQKSEDPIFSLAIPLQEQELTTTTRLILTKSEQDTPSIQPASVNNRTKPENTSNSSDPLTDLNPEHNLELHIELEDIANSSMLQDLKAEQIDAKTFLIKDENIPSTNIEDGTSQGLNNEENSDKPSSNLSGWYGKGCAKWKKRRRTNSCKKQKSCPKEDST